MQHKTVMMAARKRIALVAHDAQKANLLEWAQHNRDALSRHELWGTGTTGALLERAMGLSIHQLFSGPLGGDQQVGAMIVDGRIDFLIFFWDPLEAQPHDPDVKALLRMAVVWNIPIANDRATADFLITSPLMQATYARRVPDYEAYRRSRVAGSTDEEKSRADRPG